MNLQEATSVTCLNSNIVHVVIATVMDELTHLDMFTFY